jgi:hypothetical protein
MPHPSLASTIDLYAPKGLTAPKPPNSSNRKYIIYFITGNPGLIEYYRTYLTHLYALLAASSLASQVEFRVFGRSLSGFETDNRELKNIRSKYGAPGPPYGLQVQIMHAEKALEDLVHEEQENGAGDVRVVLMGHSVGAYMLLEIIRRVREKLLANGNHGVRIVGGVGLFPTLTHLESSESGKKYGVSRRFGFSSKHWHSVLVDDFLLIPFVVAPTDSALCSLSLDTHQGPDTSHSCQPTLATLDEEGDTRRFCSNFRRILEECMGTERDVVGGAYSTLSWN